MSDDIINEIPDRYDNRNRNRNSRNDDNDDIDLNGITKLAKTASVLKDAFSSPLETNIVSKFSENFMDRVFPMMANQPAPKQGFLDSGFMMSIGSQLPSALPTLLDVAITRLGKTNADNLVNGITNKFLSSGNNGAQQQLNSGQNIDEIILSLDPSDPADIQKYMGITGIQDEIEAQKDIITKREYLLSKKSEIQTQQQMQNEMQQQQYQNQHQQQNLSQLQEKQLQEQNEFMTQMIGAVNQDRDTIKQLNQTIESMDEKYKDVIINMNKDFNEKLQKMQDVLIHKKTNDDEDDVIEEMKEIVKEDVKEDKNSEVKEPVKKPQLIIKARKPSKSNDDVELIDDDESDEIVDAELIDEEGDEEGDENE